MVWYNKQKRGVHSDLQTTMWWPTRVYCCLWLIQLWQEWVLFCVSWMAQLVIGVYQCKPVDACRMWIFFIFISMSSVFSSTGVCFLTRASQCWLWLGHICRKGWKHRSPCCRKKVFPNHRIPLPLCFKSLIWTHFELHMIWTRNFCSL